jgi:hypothetical protein
MAQSLLITFALLRRSPDPSFIGSADLRITPLRLTIKRRTAKPVPRGEPSARPPALAPKDMIRDKRHEACNDRRQHQRYARQN